MPVFSRNWELRAVLVCTGPDIMSNIRFKGHLLRNAVCNKNIAAELGRAARFTSSLHLVMKNILGLQSHRHVQAGGGVGVSLVQPPAQSKYSPEIRQGCSGLRLLLKNSRAGDLTATLESCSND